MNKCNSKSCNYPRASWWRQSLGVDWYSPSGLQELGTLFSETTWADLNRFNVVDSNITVSGGQLNLTAGIGNFSRYILFNETSHPHRYTCLEHWKQRIKLITPSDTNGTNVFGLAIGVRSSNVSEANPTSLRWAWGSGVNNGLIVMYSNNSTTGQVLSATGLTPVANTTYVVEIERVKNVFSYTIFDAAGTTQLFTTSFSYDLTNSTTNTGHNTGQFMIQNMGGTNIKVLEWTVTSTAKVGADYAIIGASLVYGLYAQTNANRFAEKAPTDANKTFNILAGTADRTIEVLLYVPEIIALLPRKVVLNILGNDIATGVAQATYEANYNSIISQLEAEDIEVLLTTPIARTQDVSSAVTFINAKSNTKVDLFELTRTSGNTTLKASYSSGDGIHMNVLGHGDVSALLQTIL